MVSLGKYPVLSIRKRDVFLFIVVEKHLVHIFDVLMYCSRRRGKMPDGVPLSPPLGGDHYASTQRYQRADSFQTNSMQNHGYDSFAGSVPPEANDTRDAQVRKCSMQLCFRSN